MLHKIVVQIVNTIFFFKLPHFFCPNTIYIIYPTRLDRATFLAGIPWTANCLDIDIYKGKTCDFPKTLSI